MIVLDENILDSQRFLLEAWRRHPKQIGIDWGRKGLKDGEIIVLLRKHSKITFFTRNADFYVSALRHSSYCLVVLAVGQNGVAAFVRRFLRDREFNQIQRSVEEKG